MRRTMSSVASEIAKQRLNAKTTALPVMKSMPAVIGCASRLLEAAQRLDMPAVLLGEQYPQGLGPTVPELVDAASAANALVHRKTEFPLWSASARKALLAHLGTDALPFRSVLLCGIEAHVCVLQTALALAAEDIAVHVMLDGVASVHPIDFAVALERFRSTPNVFISSSQTALFQMLGAKEHPQFKPISKLVRESFPEPYMPFLNIGSDADLLEDSETEGVETPSKKND